MRNALETTCQVDARVFGDPCCEVGLGILHGLLKFDRVHSQFLGRTRLPAVGGWIVKLVIT
jgi:hypothetical protein